jgi:hypothetical protein
MKLSQAKQILMAAVQSNLSMNGGGRHAEYIVPYLIGGAGLGKTTLVVDAAKELGIGCSILSLAQYDAGELGGWPVPSADGATMVRMRPDWMPTEGSGILFLDELPQAPVANQNIAAQIANERRVGPHYLPDGWVVVAAGNKATDRAGTNHMPTHLRDRLMFLEIEANLEDTIAYYAKVGVDERIRAYLRFRPDWLHRFDRDQNACPSPRSWERVSTIMSWGINAVCMQEAISGQVGRPACVDLMGFLKVYASCPDIDELIANPDHSVVPSDAAVLYAVCASLSSRANTSNVSKILKYLRRLPQQEFAAFVMKDAISRDQSLKKVQAVRDWALTGGKDLLL